MANNKATIQTESYINPQKNEQRELSCLRAKRFAIDYCGGAPKTKILFLPGKDALEQPILDDLRFSRNNMFMVNHNHAYMAVLKPRQKRGIPKSQMAGVGIHIAMERFEKNKSKIDYAILDFMFNLCPNSLSMMRHIGSSSVWSDKLGISLTIMDMRENGNGIGGDVDAIANKYCKGNRSLARVYITMQAFCSSRGRYFKPLTRADFASYRGETRVNMVNAHFHTEIGPIPARLQPMINDINSILLRVTSTKSQVLLSNGASRRTKNGRKGRVQIAKTAQGLSPLQVARQDYIAAHPKFSGDRRTITWAMMGGKEIVTERISHTYAAKEQPFRIYVHSSPRPGMTKLWNARKAYVKAHPRYRASIKDLTWKQMGKA